MPKFSICRSLSIKAPVDEVFSIVRDFRSWPEWSPWLICEPTCKISFGDNGSSYSWDGLVVGAGKMEVRSENPNRSIQYELTFLKPWKSVSRIEFEFDETASATEVAWHMDGSLPFFMFWMKKMMVSVMEMDFDRGLRMLKDKIETGVVPSLLEFAGSQQIDGFEYLGVRTTCSIEEIEPSMERDFGKLAGFVDEHEIVRFGNAFSIYHKWDMVKGVVEYTVGIPVESVTVSLSIGIVSGRLNTTDVYSIVHTGPYYHLGNAWSAGMMFARSKVFKPDKKQPPFEIYENDPCKVPANELRANVCLPRR